MFTNHKNLIYFHQAQKLNRCQTRWFLDLADFDLKIVHVPGKLLAKPDILSHCSDLYPDDSDNSETVLLPDFLFINLINTVLHSHISLAFSTDPFVLQHLQSSLEPSIPAAFHLHLFDWEVLLNGKQLRGHLDAATRAHREIPLKAHLRVRGYWNSCVFIRQNIQPYIQDVST